VKNLQKGIDTRDNRSYNDIEESERKGNENMKKIVMIPETLDERKKTWRKHLKSVDKTRTNGYAFVGEWLRAGEREELEVGSFILCYDEPGSMKNWYPVVRLLKVGMENDLDEIFRWEGDFRERSWALAVRDDIAAILAEEQGQQPEESPLAGFSDQELIAELERRGYTAVKKEGEK